MIIHQNKPRVAIESVIVAPTDADSQSTTDLQITLKGDGPWPKWWRVNAVSSGKGQTVISLEMDTRP